MAVRSYAALAIGYYYIRRYGGFVGCYAAGQARVGVVYEIYQILVSGRCGVV